MLLFSMSFPDCLNKFLDYFYYYLFCAYVSKCKFDGKYCGSFTEDRLLVGGEPPQSLACRSSLLRSLEIFQRIDFVKKKKVSCWDTMSVHLFPAISLHTR